MNRALLRSLRIARRSAQRGFTIVSAIFLLVVLTLLGAAMVNVSTSQQMGFVSDLLGARAYAAARAGIEWGLYRVNRDSSCVAASSFVPPAPTLSGFTVTVKCTATADANGGPTVYQIDAVACNAPVGGPCPGTLGPNYVERFLRVTL